MKIFGIAGYSGSGKTTLIERLIPHIASFGLSVSVIKHAHHGFDVDRKGKDSHRHREAGAGEVLITCSSRWALLHESRDTPEPSLAEYVALLSPCDIVLVEGFKSDPLPKLEVYRPVTGKPPLWPTMADIVAVSSDTALVGLPVPILNLDDAMSIATFICRHLGFIAENSGEHRC